MALTAELKKDFGREAEEKEELTRSCDLWALRREEARRAGVAACEAQETRQVNFVKFVDMTDMLEEREQVVRAKKLEEKSS